MRKRNKQSTFNNVFNGLQVFQKYARPFVGIDIDYELLYAGCEAILDNNDENYLISLGWEWDEDSGAWTYEI